MRLCEICEDQEYYTICNGCNADCCFDCIGYCNHCGRSYLCNDECAMKGRDCFLCDSKEGCLDCMEECKFCESINHTSCNKNTEAYGKACRECEKESCSCCLQVWDEDVDINSYDEWIHETCIQDD